MEPNFKKFDTRASKKILGDLLSAHVNTLTKMNKKYSEMNDESKREWLASEINKVQKYLDWLGKESRKYATAKIGRKKIDAERPDLEGLKQ